MIFRQLFDHKSSTYTYLLADDDTKEAIIIDSVAQQVDRDTRLINELALKLRYIFDTHIHADHITGSGQLRTRFNAKTVVSKAAAIDCADLTATEGDVFKFGSHLLEVRQTPGHTDTCLTFVVRTINQVFAFTGDTLLIRGCGRTDFQMGDSQKLFHSVHQKIFSLPDHTHIFPAHDYHGFNQSTVWEEKRFNPRLKLDIDEREFVAKMASLQLANPIQMAVAVPANLNCGQVAEPNQTV